MRNQLKIDQIAGDESASPLFMLKLIKNINRYVPITVLYQDPYQINTG